MFHSVDENGYFSQSFQKVEPGRMVRLMLMPASRTWAATASQDAACQASSIEISSNSVSAWPASAISALAPAGSTVRGGSSAYSGWIGQTWWFSATVPRLA